MAAQDSCPSTAAVFLAEVAVVFVSVKSPRARGTDGRLYRARPPGRPAAVSR